MKMPNSIRIDGRVDSAVFRAAQRKPALWRWFHRKAARLVERGFADAWAPASLTGMPHTADASEVLTPKQPRFGAAGDGIEDDTAAINDCLAAGTHIFLPDGTYLVDPLDTPQAGTIIEGGPGAVLKLKDGSDGDLFTVGAVTDVVLRGFQLDGNKANQAAGTGVLRVTGATRVKLIDLTAVDGFFDGIRVDGASAEVEVEGCTSQDNNEMGMRFSGSFRGSFQGCSASGNGASGIDVDAFSSRIRINACQAFDNTSNGIFIEESSRAITVTGNTCFGNGQEGIDCNQQMTADPLQNIVIAVNVCYLNEAHGIRVTANAGGMVVQDVAIVGNTCFGNSRGSSGAFSGIKVGAATGATIRSVLIVGNRCGDRESVPTQAYGIDVDGDGTFSAIYVHGNDTTNNVTGHVNWGAGDGPENISFARMRMEASAFAANVASSRVHGDATARWALESHGGMQWGNGTDARDVTLERLAAGVLGQPAGQKYRVDEVEADTISERTAGAGITVDGCLIKDGKAANAELLDGIEGAAFLQASQAAAVTDLDQAITDPPTQAEVQAISDKVDELLASLRAAGVLA